MYKDTESMPISTRFYSTYNCSTGNFQIENLRIFSVYIFLNFHKKCILYRVHSNVHVNLLGGRGGEIGKMELIPGSSSRVCSATC